MELQNTDDFDFQNDDLKKTVSPSLTVTLRGINRFISISGIHSPYLKRFIIILGKKISAAPQIQFEFQIWNLSQSPLLCWKRKR